jgi:hypothetical protein
LERAGVHDGDTLIVEQFDRSTGRKCGHRARRGNSRGH